MAKTGKPTIKNLGEGEFEYRGVIFWRNDDVPTGYYGRYRIIGGKAFETRRELIAYLDSRAAAKAAREASHENPKE